MDRLKDLSYDDFGKFLEAEGAHEDIIRTFLDNRISGEAFLSLEEDDLKELVPIMGDRIFVKKLLQQARKTSETAILIMVRSYMYWPSVTCYVPCSYYTSSSYHVYVLVSGLKLYPSYIANCVVHS